MDTLNSEAEAYGVSHPIDVRQQLEGVLHSGLQRDLAHLYKAGLGLGLGLGLGAVDARARARVPVEAAVEVWGGDSVTCSLARVPVEAAVESI